jgi:hypothetical protein
MAAFKSVAWQGLSIRVPANASVREFRTTRSTPVVQATSPVRSSGFVVFTKRTYLFGAFAAHPTGIGMVDFARAVSPVGNGMVDFARAVSPAGMGIGLTADGVRIRMASRPRQPCIRIIESSLTRNRCCVASHRAAAATRAATGRDAVAGAWLCGCGRQPVTSANSAPGITRIAHDAAGMVPPS